MNKHILIALSIVVFILLSLNSCQQEALEDLVTKETGTDGIYLDIETGEMKDLDLSQLGSVISEHQQQNEITDRNFYRTYSDYRYHRTRGSIDNHKFLKRLKWDVTHDYETRKVGGKVNKFRFQSGHKAIDFNMKVVCTYVDDYGRNKAVFMGRVTKINQLHPHYRGRVKKGDFIYFSMKDGGGQGKTDQISGFSIIDSRTLDDAVSALSYKRKEFCYVLVDLDALVEKYLLPGKKERVPNDDWLIVRSK